MKEIILEKDYFINNAFKDRFFGNNEKIVVDEKIAKQMYLFCNCSLKFLKDLPEHLFKNWLDIFPYSLMVEWNNEQAAIDVSRLENYVNSKEFCYSHNIANSIVACLKTYFDSKIVLEKLLFLLKKVFSLLGYRRCISNDELIWFEYMEHHLDSYLCFRINKELNLNTLMNRYLITKIFEDAKFGGLVGIIGYNRYYDLIPQLIDSVLVPHVNCYANKDEPHFNIIEANRLYKLYGEALNEFGNEFREYFDKKIINGVKKQIDLNNPNFLCKQDCITVCKNVKSNVATACLYHIKNNVFFSNLSFFLDIENKNNIFAVKGTYAYVEAETICCLDFEILSKDIENDIAIIRVINPIYKFSELKTRTIAIGETVVSKGANAYLNNFYNCSFTKLKSTDNEKTINNFMCLIKPARGIWEVNTIFSFGKVEKKNNEEILIDMILPTQKYGVVAYSTDGSIVGLIKPKLNFNDVTKLIPIDYIIRLAIENI